MAVFFVRTDGSNSNDGRDALGLSLTTASYDDTGHGDGDFRLSSASAFTGVVAGARIYLSGGAGITIGLYEIGTVVSTSVVLLTVSAGSDSTSDVTSSNGAYLTIPYAINTGGTGNTAWTAGDDCIICANAAHTYASTITVDRNVATQAAPCRIIGGTAQGDHPVTGASRPTVRRITSAGTLMNVSTVSYYQFMGVIWDGNELADNAFYLNSGSIQYCKVYDCKMSNATVECFRARGHYCLIEDCEMEGGDAASVVGAFFSNITTHNRMVSCSVHDCGSHGIVVAQTSMDIEACRAYANGGDGINIQSGTFTAHVRGCTLQGNSSDGIQWDSTEGNVTISHCSASNNGAYGYNPGGLTAAQMVRIIFHHNHSYLNTSGHHNSVTVDADFLALGFGDNLVGNPSYRSTTAGSQDLEPAIGSILINAGVTGPTIAGGTSYRDIGGLQARQQPRGLPRGRSIGASDMRRLPQHAAANVMVFMTDAADLTAGLGGLTLAVTISKNGGAFGSISPTVTDRSNGWYNIALVAANTDTIGDLVLRCTSTGAVTSFTTAYVDPEPRKLSGSFTGTPSTTSLQTTSLTATDADFYADALLLITTGNAADQVQLITASSESGGTTTLTVDAFARAPAAADNFIIVNV